MTEPRTAAGRALWISVTGGDPSEEAPFGASARMIGAELAAIEAEARAAALDEARAAVEALDGVHVPMPPPQRGDHDYGLSDPKLVYADRALAAIDALREKP